MPHSLGKSEFKQQNEADLTYTQLKNQTPAPMNQATVGSINEGEKNVSMKIRAREIMSPWNSILEKYELNKNVSKIYF